MRLNSRTKISRYLASFWICDNSTAVPMPKPCFCTRARRESVFSAAGAGVGGVLFTLNTIENDTTTKTTKARNKRCFINCLLFVVGYLLWKSKALGQINYVKRYKFITQMLCSQG